jgi:EAL domain-containing protein (putative c-di-GMP-specific phosphodiesterase class I)
MRKDAVASLEFENDLRNAIDRNQFELHYQPIISLRDGRIAKFEALVRWRHPTRGLIPPLEFIPAAEDSGLILPLGDWVIAEACRQLHEWDKEFPTLAPFTASVNLSAKQLSQPDLPDRIAQILAKEELKANNLSIEITESVIMQEGPAGFAMLSRLKQLGIQVEIDDFGTGYSSFYYLQQLPIDSLKIDRAFVAHIGQRVNGNGTGSEIVQTIISLAHQLGLKVIAEGVETQEQLVSLGQLECQFAQGFLLAKPLSTQLVHQLIKESGLVLHAEWFNARK